MKIEKTYKIIMTIESQEEIDTIRTALKNIEGNSNLVEFNYIQTGITRVRELASKLGDYIYTEVYKDKK